MSIFVLGYALLLAVAIALAAWRRRGVPPYEDPNQNVTALRDKQRAMLFFGVSGEVDRERFADRQRR
jgi:hypothetical protein